MSFSRGVADGMLLNSLSSAESSATRAAADASDAEDDARRERGKAENWKRHAMEVTKIAYKNSSDAAAALIVLKGVITAMEQLPVAQREALRQKIVEVSRAKLREYDSDPDHTSNPNYISVVKTFEGFSHNKALGVV